MATNTLSISLTKGAYIRSGNIYNDAGVFNITSLSPQAGIDKQTGVGMLQYTYYASGVKFGSLTASDFTNKYFSSLTITISSTLALAYFFTALTAAVNSTSDGYTAYQNYTNGTVIYTATPGSTATITVTDSALIRNILLYGIGVGHTASESYGSITASSISLSYTYTDGATPSVVSNLSPAGTTILSTAAQRFSWTFYQESGAVQTHYDLQYSTDDGATWTTLANKVASANAYRDVSANTFTAGVLTWRVRTWTVSGTIASDWVSAQIIVRTNPTTSTVTCDGKPRPTVSWTASGYVAYQVKIGDRDSGAIFGTATSFKSPYYFTDGLYPVTIRVQSSTGVWTDWTTIIYSQITNTSSGSVSLTAVQDGCNARLSWTTESTCVAYVVFRNGIQIAQTTATQYIDYYSNGTTTYRVIGILSTGYYVSSIDIILPLRMPHDVVSPIPNINWLYLRYSLTPQTRAYDTSVNVVYKYYAGRKKPVAVTDGHSTRSFRAVYSSSTRELIDALTALTGQTVILKDTKGDRIIGVLGNSGYDSERIFPIDLSIVETDYNEEIAYVG
jgi:hypothetical protein